MLPLLLDNIPYYKIEGSYAFCGDLIIIPRIIYYLPHTDLEQERINRGGDLQPGIPGSKALGDLFTKMLSGFGISQSSSHPRSQIVELWNSGDSSKAIQSRLDAHIAGLKQNKPPMFSNSVSTSPLPMPGRFIAGSINDVRMDSGGVLSFQDSSDRHDFDIGVKRIKLIGNALSEAGFTVIV
ncbi:MAG: hypothetical protein WBV94_28865 [Blastocatellia bacterium]